MTFEMFFWPAMIGLVYLFIRNLLVGRERQRVIDTIAHLGYDDIEARRPFMWRWEAFYAISYEKMLFSLRRVKSFYKDSPALQHDPDQNVWDFLDGKPQ